MLARREGGGVFEVINATVNGRFGQPQPDEWKGEVKLSQGRVVLGPNRIPVENLSGTMMFDPATIQLMDLKGAFGPVRISNGTLMLSHVQVAPRWNLDMAGEVEAGELLRFLRSTGDPKPGWACCRRSAKRPVGSGCQSA
jgi:hypothetical protein